MKKTLLPGLLAAALLSLTLPSCGPSAAEGDDDVATTARAPPTPPPPPPSVDSEDDIVTTALPPLPAAPDTTKGAKQPEQMRELNSVNATEDIKKMQPQM